MSSCNSSEEKNRITCSVAIATYNGALYIEKQINSIINQTQRVDEIVISDDGSFDNTLEIVRKISESPDAEGIDFVILTDNPRHGYCGNFEHAISRCNGDYIFLSDQDDIWFENKVERVVNAFEDDPGLLLVFHDALLIDKDDNRISAEFNIFRCPHGKLSRELFLEKGASTTILPGMVMCISKKLLPFALPFPEISGSHDQWIQFCALCQDGVYYLDEQLASYRLHTNNTSGGRKANNMGVRDKIYRIKKQIINYSNMKENKEIYILGSAMKDKLIECKLEKTPAYEAAEQICEIGLLVDDAYHSNRIVGFHKLNKLYFKNTRYKKSGTTVHLYRLAGLLFRRNKNRA